MEKSRRASSPSIDQPPVRFQRKLRIDAQQAVAAAHDRVHDAAGRSEAVLHRVRALRQRVREQRIQHRFAQRPARFHSAQNDPAALTSSSRGPGWPAASRRFAGSFASACRWTLRVRRDTSRCASLVSCPVAVTPVCSSARTCPSCCVTDCASCPICALICDATAWPCVASEFCISWRTAESCASERRPADHTIAPPPRLQAWLR